MTKAAWTLRIWRWFGYVLLGWFLLSMNPRFGLLGFVSFTIFSVTWYAIYSLVLDLSNRQRR